MTSAQQQVDAAAIIERLGRAIDERDLDGLVGCFASDVCSEQPVHPERNFTGSDQVRRNWTQIFAAVPDLHATLVRSTAVANTGWAEWEWSGTRADGVAFALCGVTIIGVRDGAVAWTRFYMEPAQRDGADVETAVRQVVTGR